jgi:hypothetical protein
MTIFHNMREAPTVERESNVRPTAWRIVRTPVGACHLVAVLDSGSLRLTSALQVTHVAYRTAITQSGRTYQLDAGPARDPVSIAQLLARARLELGDDYEDVSDEVWNQMVRASQ